MYELDNPEKIREVNVQRLHRLQDTFKKHQLVVKNDRGDEFANIYQPKTLDKFDDKLYHLLTPNPTHSKSYGLISTGANLVKTDSHKKIDRLREIESNYLDQYPSPVIDEKNPYSSTLARTLLFDWF